MEKGLVPDILREAGPKVRQSFLWRLPFLISIVKGLHVNDIAAINKVDSTKLGEHARVSTFVMGLT